ncbi:heme peroxidase [Ramaria rubella]|nr:heme peroxidase [Ramaria rubella]
MSNGYPQGQEPSSTLASILLRATSYRDDGPSHVSRVAALDFKSPELPPLSNGGEHTPHSSILGGIEAQLKRGSPINLSTFGAVWDALKNQNGVGLDDRKFLLEEVLVFMSRLPPGSQLATQVEHFMIDFLYKDLPHPPSTYLGPIVPSTSSTGLTTFAYREPDGSRNNPLLPALGAAHMPYARSVPSTHVAPFATLPDPGLVFDTLLKRDKQKDVDHPTGLSSLFFAFANLIIHSLFRTNRTDWSINDTSSYLDLSPLYGVDTTEQERVRRFDGTGRMWDDVFADMRLLGMPPAVGALLVVFNRNHNFVATRLLAINERGTLVPEDKLASIGSEQRRNQDDEIFNRARLINCGAFMQVIMRDYVGAILRMIPDLTPWHLRPLDPIRDSHHDITPRGEGNVCSVEFNLLYRWHATTSLKDEKWLDDQWKRLFNKPYDDITPADFVRTVGKDLYQGPDVKQWTFGRLQRDATTGRFSDADIAGLLQTATADAAQAFRARGIPAAFRVIEIMGIQQARSWGVCSLNEFRSFLGLKPYASFTEWNSNKDIAAAAEQLYRHIDNMELYVGMQAEETRPSIPGSGLCSGYTMSRSILADAVALIRGDRFLTIEYTPFNLTSWGFQDVTTTDDNGSLGGMLTKLLFRTLPDHYPAGSVYAHFPFIHPARMHDNMLHKEPNWVALYDWTEPRSVPTVRPVQAREAVKDIVVGRGFKAAYERFAAELMGGIGRGFCVAVGGEDERNRRNRTTIERLLFTPDANAEHAQCFYEVTRELMVDKAFAPVGAAYRTVDIVHEVINYVPLHWLTTRVASLPLRTKENPGGKYSEHELYSYLAVIFSYIYLNTEPVNAWFLTRHAHKAAKVILDDVAALLSVEASLFRTVRGVVGRLTGYSSSDAKPDLLHQLLEGRHRDIHDDSNEDIMYNILSVAVNSVANWAHAMTHVVNFYLDSARKSDKDAIVALAGLPLTGESESLLIGYIREALRLDPPIAGVLREARTDTIVGTTQVHAGERLYADLATALVDETVYGAEATTVDPLRPTSELSFVTGAHSSLNEEFSDKTMAQVLRAVFGKKNLRRAPGLSGQLTRFAEKLHDTEQKVYVDHTGKPTPWPQSMLVQYDI